jgi:hypothetical protein
VRAWLEYTGLELENCLEAEYVACWAETPLLDGGHGYRGDQTADGSQSDFLHDVGQDYRFEARLNPVLIFCSSIAGKNRLFTGF